LPKSATRAQDALAPDDLLHLGNGGRLGGGAAAAARATEARLALVHVELVRKDGKLVEDVLQLVGFGVGGLQRSSGGGRRQGVPAFSSASLTDASSTARRT